MATKEEAAAKAAAKAAEEAAAKAAAKAAEEAAEEAAAKAAEEAAKKPAKTVHGHFIKKPTIFKLAYGVAMEAELPADQAAELIELGYFVKGSAPQELIDANTPAPLPPQYTGRAAERRAGKNAKKPQYTPEQLKQKKEHDALLEKQKAAKEQARAERRK